MPVLRIDARDLSRGIRRDLEGNASGIGVVAPRGFYTYASAIDLLRLSREGHIAPGYTFTVLADASTRVNALPLNGCVDSAGEAFSVLDNARVVQFGVADGVIDAHNATAHGAHTNLAGEDILPYKNATDEYVLYSFNDATDADVGRRTKSSGAYDDDWLSTIATQTNGSTLTLGVPHKMVIGPDGGIHITNGQYLAYHDPSSTAVDYKKLNLGYGFVATDIKRKGSYLVISGYQANTYITSFSRAESRVWYWDTTSPFYNFVYDLKDNYVSALGLGESLLYAFTQGRGGTTKVKALTGSEFETLFEHTGMGNPPKPGSIEFMRGILEYGEPAGNCGLYGVDGRAFHNPTLVTTDGQTSSSALGMVKNLSGSGLYVGRKTGSDYHIVKQNFSGYYINADMRTAAYELPYKSRLTKIIIHLSQFGTGASLLFSLFKNFATVSLGGGSDLTALTLTNAVYGAVASITIPAKSLAKCKDINTLMLNLRFNHATATATAAVVRAIDIHYQPTEKV